MSRGERIKGPGPLEAIIADPDKYTLKRAAWAYGCAAKGSEIEAALLAVLIEKTRIARLQGPPRITVTKFAREYMGTWKETPPVPPPTIKFAPVEPGTGINGSDFHPTPFFPPFSVPIGKPILREDPMEAFGSRKPWWYGTPASSRPSSHCHPGDRCEN